MFNKNVKNSIAIASFAVITAGCVVEEPGELDPANIVDLSVDASDYSSYRYVDLVNQQVLDLTAEQAASSTAWHIAFNRYNVILNGGTSGLGEVAGALAVSQEDFYQADGSPDANMFLNASTATEQEHLLEPIDTSTLTLEQDAYQPAIKGSGAVENGIMDLGWYNYNTATHAITVNSENLWLLRSAAGDSYGKFYASNLTYDFVTGLQVTFDFEVQPAGASSFSSTAIFEASLPAAGGEVCFDFDADSNTDCSDSNWDLKLEVAGRNWNLWTNGGSSGDGQGEALGPFTSAQSVVYASGTTDLLGNDISSYYTSDQTASVFSSDNWYEYNLQGQHQLWPNYRVYLIDTDSSDESAEQYRVQLTDYYSTAGASGHISLRILQNP